MKYFSFFSKNKITDIIVNLKTKPSSYWIKKGEKVVLDLFKYSYINVTAYKNFLINRKIVPNKIKTIEDFKNLPFLNKINYIKKNKLINLVPDQDISLSTTLAATSGSTGEPTYFPRGEYQDKQYEYIAEVFMTNQFCLNRKKTLGLIGFGLGIWIGGIFTYKNFNVMSGKGYPLTLAPIGTNKEVFLTTLKKTGKYFDQILLMGYPPFIKDVVDEAKDYGIDWRKYKVKIITATESFSEKFREYLAKKAFIKNEFTDIVNIYGSVELGTMAHETALTTLIRKLAVSDSKVFSKIFPHATGLPTLCQYHPYLTFFEEVTNEIIASGYGSSFPLLRYQHHDRGGVVEFEKMRSNLFDIGIDIIKEAKIQNINQTILKLPFVYVCERSDFVVILRGANIYPAQIRNALQHDKLEKYLTGKFTMRIRENRSASEYLEINIELKKKSKDSFILRKLIKQIIVDILLKENSEYSYLYKMEGRKRLQPKIVLFSYQHPKYFHIGIKHRWVK